MSQRRNPNSIADRLSREDQARLRMDIALGDRGFAFAGFEPPSDGKGVVAVAINGDKVLMHLGRDEVDAMFRLASMAARP